MMNNGKFIISLDFELFWGMRDERTIEQYGENIKGVHQALPRLLEVFNTYQVKATFAIVGFLFFENKVELLNNLPEKQPSYLNKNLSPYAGHFEVIGKNAESDPYHFAPHLIRLIRTYPEQEIGTHTFSHYYCLEDGQTKDEFKADLESALKIATKQSLKITSLVFPRNQFNDGYLQVCKDLGIICYRGNEKSRLYEARNGLKESLFRRALRLADAYINISGYNCYSDTDLKNKLPVNIPSSRFLRPYSEGLKVFDKLRLNRIQNAMTYAARNNLTYHLWWHPHNFGINQDENFSFLEKILQHYTKLNTEFKFRCYTMSELATLILSNQ